MHPAWWAGFSQCLGEVKGIGIALTSSALALFGSGATSELRAAPFVWLHTPTRDLESPVFIPGKEKVGFGAGIQAHPGRSVQTAEQPLVLLWKRHVVELGQPESRCRTMGCKFWGISFHMSIPLGMMRAVQNGTPWLNNWCVCPPWELFRKWLRVLLKSFKPWRGRRWTGLHLGSESRSVNKDGTGTGFCVRVSGV